MADFHDISLEQKLKAFERARDESNFPEGKVILVTEKYYDAALRIARESFLKDEPISRSVNLQWSSELEELWLDTFKANLTVALLDDVSGAIIAFRGILVQDKDFKYDSSHSNDLGFIICTNIFKCCEEGAKFFEKFQVNQAFHFYGLGVRGKYSHRGIGDRLFKLAINFLRHLVPGKFCIKGDTTSMFSSRIYEKNHFEKLYELPYTEFLTDGKQVICNTGDHKSFKIWAIQVNGHAISD